MPLAHDPSSTIASSTRCPVPAPERTWFPPRPVPYQGTAGILFREPLAPEPSAIRPGSDLLDGWFTNPVRPLGLALNPYAGQVRR